MAYDNNVPLATDLVSATQQPIHDNYADIDTLINVNHVGFNVANQGKHKFVQMPVRAVTPVPAATELNLFTRQSAFTAQPELCVARSTGEVIEMTSADASAPTGWAFTSAGLLIKWGQGIIPPPGGATSIVYPVAANIPIFTTVFNVMITVQYASGVDENTSATLVSFANPAFFDAVASQRTATLPTAANVFIFYFAIGKP